MAMAMRRTLVCLHRSTCSTLKNAETSLDVVRHPVPLFLPVRTKKRAFIPPVKGTKGKTKKTVEDKARSAGIVFRQQYVERPINITCTAGVFEAYIPPEGESRLSTLSKEGLKQRGEQVRQMAASKLAFRKIKEYDPEFNSSNFAVQAQEIFIEAHDALSNFNKQKLHSLVTEKCYPEMTRGNRYKTIRWRFVESLEPPKVVHARCPDMVSRSNIYGQVTVRMHSRQILAIYDRFGRLMLGSEEQPKDVLEYVVIERHLTNPYGRWRLHAKMMPDWAPVRDQIVKTIMIPGSERLPGEEFDPLTQPQAVQGNK